MRNGAQQYQRNSEAGISARDTEIAAFSRVNRELAAATADADRVKALGHNHDLWSALIKDLALSSNPMPEPLKTQLIDLAAWSMRYSIHATLHGLKIDPLLEVNRNVLDGLLAQSPCRHDSLPHAPGGSIAI